MYVVPWHRRTNAKARRLCEYHRCRGGLRNASAEPLNDRMHAGCDLPVCGNLVQCPASRLKV